MENISKLLGDDRPQTEMIEQMRRTKKCKTPLQKKIENYLHFETREEKILEIFQQES